MDKESLYTKMVIKGSVMKDSKSVYYDIYSEFYSVNKFRELKSIMHHGDNRLNHINRVAKMSFIISKKLGYDYISCTRGAMMHDFFTKSDLNKKDTKFKNFLKEHPNIALKNANKFFDMNVIEEDIITSHMFPITHNKPKYAESKIVCIADKLVGIYEFLRYELGFTYVFAYILSVRVLL